MTTAAAARPTSKAAHARAQESFEAVTLQILLGSMMPNDQGGLFGAGPAGRMWKSLMVEKLAEQIAQSGSLSLIPRSAKPEAGTNSESSLATSPAAAETAKTTAGSSR